MRGKLKLKKQFDKDNFLKKYMGKHYSETKTLWGNNITIHNVLKKKTTKQNQQRLFWKKKEKKFIKKSHVWKHCSNP
jgi:hypothetical protein